MATHSLRVVRNLNLDRLIPADLEYFCISDDIDREVMKRKGKSYNEDLAFKSLYFIVTTDKRIAVLPMKEFDHWRMVNDVFPMVEQSEPAKEAIDWFIGEVHGIKEVV